MRDAFELVHFNLAWARFPTDHPAMADFAGQLDRVNQLARAAPGFLWMLDEEGFRQAAEIFGSALALPNMSVWASIESLRRYVYGGEHGAAVRRRREWFEARAPAYVLWWTPAGVRPDLREGKRRIEQLAAHGPAPGAFSFTHAFDSSGTPLERP